MSGVPSSEEIKKLPRWAKVALSIRCSKRLFSEMTASSFLSFHPVMRVPRVPLESFEQVLQISDDLSSNRPVSYPLDWIEGYADFQSNATHDIAALSVFETLLAAAKAALAVQSSDKSKADEYLRDFISGITWVVNTIPTKSIQCSKDHIREIRNDFELLLAASATENWNDKTPVPQDFFSLRSEFYSDKIRGDPQIIEIGDLIGDKLFEYFRSNPERLYTLQPREFEELVAKLFEEFGYIVELTKRTRDGGRDIVAIENSIIKTKYLIECKRYKKTNTIGVQLVRQLHGVVEDEKATKGILVTTGRFSKEALAHFDRHRWILEGRDFDGLMEWLNIYQKLQIQKTRTKLISEQVREFY